MSEFYQPDYARGFRFDDPAINIELPFSITTLAEKDAKTSKLFVSTD
jgi:dTDP-4-dehydrorhamnose 3,5-epimerase